MMFGTSSSLSALSSLNSPFLRFFVFSARPGIMFLLASSSMIFSQSSGTPGLFKRSSDDSTLIFSRFDSSSTLNVFSFKTPDKLITIAIITNNIIMLNRSSVE